MDVADTPSSDQDPFQEPPARILPSAFGRVNALAECVLSDGTVRLASAGADGTVRLWDPDTGTQIGEPLTGHTGWVRALTTVTVNGRDLLASAGDDGTVRLWDPDTGTQIGEPLTGHTGSVRALTTVTVNGRDLLASAGDDSAILIWTSSWGASRDAEIPPSIIERPAATAPEALEEIPTPSDAGSPGVAAAVEAADEIPTRSDAFPTVDRVRTRDLLGRRVLAVHLDALMFRLSDEQSDGTAVAHLDGRWGAGKTTLVNLMLEPGLCGPDNEPRQLIDPVVVSYNAWRESAIAPEWWSLAAALNRGIGSRRGWPARAAMWADGLWDRVRRTPALLVTAAVVLVIFFALRHVRADFKVVGTSVAGLIAGLVVIFTIGRAMFWTSPFFGRIDLKAGDNPLGEIAAQVALMRRWTPRQGVRQHRRDWVIGALVMVAIVGVGFLLVGGDGFGWNAGAGGITAGALVTAMLIVRNLSRKPRVPVLLIIDDLDRCEAERVVKLMQTIHTGFRESHEPRRWSNLRRPAPLVVLVLADGRWVRTAFETSFSDFAGLGSDVHSLGADFIQKLFDHTVIVPTLTVAQIDDYVRTLSRSVSAAESNKVRGRSADIAQTALTDPVDDDDPPPPDGEREDGNDPLPRDAAGEEAAGEHDRADQHADVSDVEALQQDIRDAWVSNIDETGVSIWVP